MIGRQLDGIGRLLFPVLRTLAVLCGAGAFLLAWSGQWALAASFARAAALSALPVAAPFIAVRLVGAFHRYRAGQRRLSR